MHDYLLPTRRLLGARKDRDEAVLLSCKMSMPRGDVLVGPSGNTILEDVSILRSY